MRTNNESIIGCGGIRHKVAHKFKPQVNRDTVVESVNYKNSARANHRRRIIDETADAKDRIKDAGNVLKVTSEGLIKVDKRTKAYRMKMVRNGCLL